MGKRAPHFQRNDGQGARSGQDLLVGLSVIEVQTLIGIIEEVMPKTTLDEHERTELRALAQKLARAVPESEW